MLSYRAVSWGDPDGEGGGIMGVILLTNEAGSEIQFDQFSAASHLACVVGVARHNQLFSVVHERHIVAKRPSYEEPLLRSSNDR